jgi:hypothetical protein
VLASALEGPRAAAVRCALADAVVRAFDNSDRRGVSMRRFAKRFFPLAAGDAAGAAGDAREAEAEGRMGAAPEPMEVQVALYAQGLRYHNSQARSSSSGGGSGDSALGLASLGRARAVLRALAAEERQKVYFEPLLPFFTVA